ncbi:OmpA family protein [Amycolatopsis nigrescens]|uniref:OmpA family protein n=1 Tax=Amycolatopsis nigrescens TaxID=381445 RepID=UPI00035C0DC1|nr:OmpA family protein [Amycolatopsis nigrescens]
MSAGTIAPLARATQLARNGQYRAAGDVLRELGGRDSDDPAVLDLQARIHAQRGELFDADECWVLAQRLDGDLPGAREGRRRIAALQARGVRPRTGRVVLVVALAAGVVTGAGVVGALLTRQQPGPDPAVLAGLNGVQGSQREQARQLDAINDRLDQTAQRRQGVLDELTAALAGNRAASAHVESGTLVVSFPVGVFTTGVQLSNDGRAALAGLAQRLRGLSTKVSVAVVGHTSDSPVSGTGEFTDNVDLGQARAKTAAEWMSQASALPLSMFALSSAGAADPPFPNTAADGRAQNRTVTVVLRPE